MKTQSLSELSRKINPNLYWSFASKGLAAVGFFTVDILIARNLGVSSYGQWTTFYSALMILQGALAIGIPQASQVLNARYKGKPELKGQLSASIITQASISFSLIVILLFARNFVADFYQQPFFADLFLLALPYLFLYSALDNLKFNFVGLQKVRNHFVLNLFEFGLKVILVLLFLKSTPMISDVINAYTISVSIPFIIGTAIIIKIIRSLDDQVSLKKSVRALVTFSLPFTALIFISVLTREMNIQMLALLTNEHEVAMLGIGKQIAGKLPQLTMAVTMGTIPKLAQITKENFEKKKKYLIRIFTANFGINLLVFIVFIIIAPFIVNVLYSTEFNQAILPFRISLLFTLFYSSTYFLSQFIDVQGKTKNRLLISLFSLVVLFISNLILIPSYGAVGAASSLIISAIPSLILTVLYTRHILKILQGQD